MTGQNSENQGTNHFIVTKLWYVCVSVCNICPDWIIHTNIKNPRGIYQNVTIK